MVKDGEWDCINLDEIRNREGKFLLSIVILYLQSGMTPLMLSSYMGRVDILDLIYQVTINNWLNWIELIDNENLVVIV